MVEERKMERRDGEEKIWKKSRNEKKVKDWRIDMRRNREGKFKIGKQS